MSKPITIIDDGYSCVKVYLDWLNNADTCFEKLQQSVDWTRRDITLFGKKHTIPRKEAWVGEPGISYRYSGQTYMAQGWPEAISQVPKLMQNAFGWKPNSALLNYYLDGQSSMGWHSDDEVELGNNPKVAILSLGHSRTFQLRHRQDNSKKHSIDLPDGSLLLMTKATQHHWQHGVPKRAKVKGVRISCTFREVFN